MLWRDSSLSLACFAPNKSFIAFNRLQRCLTSCRHTLTVSAHRLDCFFFGFLNSQTVLITETFTVTAISTNLEGMPYFPANASQIRPHYY